MVAARSHVRAQITWLALMDLACLLLASVIGVLVRFGHQEMSEYVFNHLDGWLLLFGGVILANYLAGCYRLQFAFSRFNLIVTWLFSLLFALLILSITSYTWIIVVLGRGVLVLSLAAYSVLALFLKLVVYGRLFRSENFVCRTAILGTGKHAIECARVLGSKFVLPAHKTVGFIRTSGRAVAAQAEGNSAAVPVLDSAPDALEETVRRLGASLVVIALDDPKEESRLYPYLRRFRFKGVEVLSRLGLAEIYSGRTPLDLIDEEFLMQISLESGLPMVWRVKRLTDIVLSIFALVLSAPLLAAVAICMKIASPRHPILYSQLRVGRFGSIFRIYKIRTMRVGAERETGPVWCAVDDPRVTRLGRILRRFRIDEIPQCFNVLRGDMSLVGPRPERPELNALLATQIPFYEERENVMPGLTGWAQIRYPYGNSVEDAKRKLEYDLYYIKHLSLSLDLQIILSTLRIVILGHERPV